MFHRYAFEHPLHQFDREASDVVYPPRPLRPAHGGSGRDLVENFYCEWIFQIIIAYFGEIGRFQGLHAESLRNCTACRVGTILITHLEDSKIAESSCHIIHRDLGGILLWAWYHPPEARTTTFRPWTELKRLSTSMLGTLIRETATSGTNRAHIFASWHH